MTSLPDRLLAIHGPLLYVLVAAVVFVEDAVFVGFVVPGETAAVLGGVAASLGHASLAGLMVTVVAAAIVGDTVGYEVGRHLGPRLLDSRLLRGRREQLDRARKFLAVRGGAAVFLGRVSKDLEASPGFPQVQPFSIFSLVYYPRQRWGAYRARSKIV